MYGKAADLNSSGVSSHARSNHNQVVPVSPVLMRDFSNFTSLLVFRMQDKAQTA
jgi:hypothetical protein